MHLFYTNKDTYGLKKWIWVYLKIYPGFVEEQVFWSIFNTKTILRHKLFLKVWQHFEDTAKLLKKKEK